MTDNNLVHGDPMNPQASDLIAQTMSLDVGLPVPEGWRVLTGKANSSQIARVAFRDEIDPGFSATKIIFDNATLVAALRLAVATWREDSAIAGDHASLAAQFTKQADDAESLADELDCGGPVTLTMESN